VRFSNSASTRSRYPSDAARKIVHEERGPRGALLVHERGSQDAQRRRHEEQAHVQDGGGVRKRLLVAAGRADRVHRQPDAAECPQ